jgi:hypothetical protein
MALIVTPGASDAESYLDVAAADAFAAGDLGAYAEGWSAAKTEASLTGPNRLRKEAALRRASRDVDELVGLVSSPYSLTQALVFPRSWDLEAGVLIIPAGVRRETYRQAAYLFANAHVLDQAATRQARGLSSFGEPNVSGTISTEPNAGRFAPGLAVALQPFAGASTVGWISLS